MTNLCLLTKIVLVSLVMASFWAGSWATAKPGCQEECGGVKIPFPFGIGSGCYFINSQIDPLSKEYDAFRIKCNNSINRPAPFIGHNYTFRGLTRPDPRTIPYKYGENFYHDLLSIDLKDHTLRVSSRVAYECYNNGEPLDPSSALNNNTNKYVLDNLSPFSISVTRNRLMAIGCDTSARVGDTYIMAGCMTFCDPSSNFTDGVCAGVGCCETSIFDGMLTPSVSVTTVDYNISDPLINSKCKYAFIGEVGSYNFSLVTLFSASEQDCGSLRIPVVYDWSISSNVSCSKHEEAAHGTLLCGLNTYCVDAPGGYRCQCLEGFIGNQYLPQGCQDINECEDERLNDCRRHQHCVNKEGGYDCREVLKPILGVAISMSSIVVFIILYGIFKLFKKRREIQERENNFKRNGGLLLQQEISPNDGAIHRAKIFSRIDLERATDNFSDNRVLGRGGQGTVYKGMLVDGTIVAVKKSKKVDENQLSQFINEVVILSQINHRNIVKLFGCCLETEVPLLVYEFVPNGTLYQHIHHPSEDFHMTWRVRFQIAVECATAISYLHSSCSSPIYHRDIKSSNILLDEKYRAKISDFGTSRSISIEKTHVTTCVQGTLGYLDPKFFRSSQFNEKSDVYSFGVVLLELLTSMKPIFRSTSGEPRGLATEFIQIMETNPDQVNSILDTQVLQNCSKEEIEALTLLIERCLSLNGKQRPTMREVAMTLEMIKKQFDEEGNDASMQVITRPEDHCPCSSTSNFSAFTYSFQYSMGVEPLLFDSN